MKYNFPSEALIWIKGVPHRHIPDAGNELMRFAHATSGTIYIHTRLDGSTGLPTIEEFDTMRAAGEVEIVDNPGQREGVLQDEFATAEWDAADCEAIDPGSRRMLAVARWLDDKGVGRSFKAIDRALTRDWDENLQKEFGQAPNAHTVKRWLLRGEPGHRTPKAMVRKWGRTSTSSFDPRAQAVLMKAALGYWIGGPNTTFMSAWSECARNIGLLNAGEHPDHDPPAEPFKTPSYDTVRRACLKLEGPETQAARNGKQMAKSEWHGAGRGFYANRPLQVGVIDHSPIPGTFVVDPTRCIVLGRSWLSTMIDVYTGVTLAWVVTFNSPSLGTVAELMRRANRPKRPPTDMADRYPDLARIMGKCSLIVVDNGAEFRGHGLESMAAGAGFSVRFCGVKSPTERAVVERRFGTVFSMLKENLPGANMPIEWTRKADYDPEEDAVVCMEDLEGILNHVFAEIHTRPSEALDGRQPLLMWKRGTETHGIDVWWDADAATKELLDVRNDVQLSKSGIRLFGLRYHDIRSVPELLADLVPFEPRRQRRADATATVKIKFDPADISVIHVWNRKTLRYCTLSCDDETYSSGMPLWLHERIRADAKAEGEAFNTQEERLLARSRCIQAIKAIAPKTAMKERKQFARLLEIPRIRQMTGNLVEMLETDPELVGPGPRAFIANDIASLTSLDTEILSRRDPIAAGKADPVRGRSALTGREALPTRRRSSRRDGGEVK